MHLGNSGYSVPFEIIRSGDPLCGHNLCTCSHICPAGVCLHAWGCASSRIPAAAASERLMWPPVWGEDLESGGQEGALWRTGEGAAQTRGLLDVCPVDTSAQGSILSRRMWGSRLAGLQRVWRGPLTRHNLAPKLRVFGVWVSLSGGRSFLTLFGKWNSVLMGAQWSSGQEAQRGLHCFCSTVTMHNWRCGSSTSQCGNINRPCVPIHMLPYCLAWPKSTCTK